MWTPTTPIEKKFLKYARALPREFQCAIFKPFFQVQVIEQVSGAIAPKDYVSLDTLVPNRCNFPSRLTLRGQLCPNKEYPCKRRVKNNEYFCKLEAHQQFRVMSQLPAGSLQATTTDSDSNSLVNYRNMKRKPVKHYYGKRFYQDPLHANTFMSQPFWMNAAASSSQPTTVSLPAATSPLLPTTTTTTTEEPWTCYTQCVFESPVTGQQCNEHGVYRDNDEGYYFCTSHVHVTQELMDECRGDPEWFAIATQLQSIDSVLAANATLSTDATSSSLVSSSLDPLVKERKRLAAKLGLGTVFDMANQKSISQNSAATPVGNAACNWIK